MRARIGAGSLELRRGDITREGVDAIVTAANSALAGGGGVDGAVHRAAGPELLAECRKIGGCPIGDAVATPPGRLPVRAVVHAVGPVYGACGGREDELLARAHRRALEVAGEAGCRSIAFPAISCGVYGFPVERAARIALETIRDHLLGGSPPHEVRYVLFGARELEVFRGALRELVERDPRVVLGG